MANQLPEMVTVKKSDRYEWIRKSAILSTLVSLIEDGLIEDLEDVKSSLRNLGIEVKDATD